MRGYGFERVRLRRRRCIMRSISADASALELGQANERRDAYAILFKVAICLSVGGFIVTARAASHPLAGEGLRG